MQLQIKKNKNHNYALLINLLNSDDAILNRDALWCSLGKNIIYMYMAAIVGEIDHERLILFFFRIFESMGYLNQFSKYMQSHHAI